jgi:hypothetical protein
LQCMSQVQVQCICRCSVYAVGGCACSRCSACNRCSRRNTLNTVSSSQVRMLAVHYTPHTLYSYCIIISDAHARSTLHHTPHTPYHTLHSYSICFQDLLDPDWLAMRSLCTHYTLTVHSLCAHHTLTVHSLYTHYAPTMRPLCAHYALTVHSLCTHCGLTMHSLCTHYALTMLSPSTAGRISIDDPVFCSRDAKCAAHLLAHLAPPRLF